MTRVHVYGASGYAAAEAITLLARHPEVELGVLESGSHAGEHIGLHFPALRRLCRCFDAQGAVLAQAARGDVVILGGAHGTAKALVSSLLEIGAKVIDLSGDFRLPPTPAVYGYAELYREAIAAADLIANPGCYPTATLLATLPLAPFAPQHIIVDAKSGVSGAGRTPAVTSLFAEVAGDVRAYGLQGHRHEAEIVAQWRAANINACLTFTPHVVPIARGMLVDTYCVLPHAIDIQQVRDAFTQAYEHNVFVRLLPDGCAPNIPAVVGTNDAELSLSVHGEVVRVICAIDNLGRGAAGQAIRNLNIMHGYQEDLGLRAYACAVSA
jgi:N-acetyl-gamma-glutamyl-phosphate reductase